MTSTSIQLGTEAELRDLYSYPNLPDSSESLAETITFWMNQTLERDGVRATPKVQIRDGSVSLELEGPAEDAAALAAYADRIPRFLAHGSRALEVCSALKDQSTSFPPGTPGIADPARAPAWDPQELGSWRFFLPLGMPMVNQRALQFFHYPPLRLLDPMRDYLDDPVPVRLIELLIANGVRDEKEAWLYSTVMDGAPIAAPDDQGTIYLKDDAGKIKETIHLIPIEHFAEYQRGQTELLLNRSRAREGFTDPVVVYGAPARAVFEKLYGVKLTSNDALTVEVVPGLRTAVMVSGHPYRFYAQGQIDDATGSAVGSGTLRPGQGSQLVRIMKEDLVVAGWQHRMSMDPSQDPAALVRDLKGHWDHSDQAAEVAALVVHQGSLHYPDPNSLSFVNRISMDEAREIVAGSRGDIEAAIKAMGAPEPA